MQDIIKYDNKQMQDIIDYLAWCIRANCFEKSFIEKFSIYGIDNFGWDIPYASVYSKDMFNRVHERGIIYAYQCAIHDNEGIEALIYAINV
jgi:hypothetical protein